MNLKSIVDRKNQPAPWEEGDNIPWNEPGFSERMLSEHLSQSHDAASRRSEKIDEQVAWIWNECLHGKPGRVLDLGCGPGLYSSRLARQGCECVGIDYSPASITYARQQADRERLNCLYHHQDIRVADYGSGFDMAMLIYGEINIFSRDDALLILRRAAQALKPGGCLLLEVHDYPSIEAEGNTPSNWFSSSGGLFAPEPHLVLRENFWYAEHGIATLRYYVINAFDGAVTRMGQSYQAYHPEQYAELLSEAGLTSVQSFPSLGGIHTDGPSKFNAITAQRPA